MKVNMNADPDPDRALNVLSAVILSPNILVASFHRDQNLSWEKKENGCPQKKRWRQIMPEGRVGRKGEDEDRDKQKEFTKTGLIEGEWKGKREVQRNDKRQQYGVHKAVMD